MGSSASRMEEGEAAAATSTGAGDASAGIRPLRRGIEELRRRKDGMKVRKDSIVSATELLLPEERDASDAESPPDMSVAIDGCAAAAAADLQENCRVEERKVEEEDANKVLAVEEAEEAAPPPLSPVVELGRWKDLPGSPSFRIYYVERDSDDDGSFKAPYRMNNTTRKGKLHENAERIVEEEAMEEKRHEREGSGESTNSGEELLEQKQQKKKKTTKKGKVDGRRRMKALWKSPSRMYRLLNVRNCYHVHNGAAAAGDGASPPPAPNIAAAAHI